MADNDRHRSNGGFQDDIIRVPSSSRPNFLSIFNRDTNYPIFRTFCECLSIAEIVSLTRTCKSLSGLYQYLLPMLWDVDKALGRYFDDPVGFRSQMAEYDALIFGKFPAQYFERVIWECEPLEILVEDEENAILLSYYLRLEAGYSLQKGGPFEEIWTFKRKSDRNTTIHLHMTMHPPIQEILYETKTTVGSSFMSWNRAYSLFALPTSIQHKTYLLRSHVEGRTEKAARPYSEKGWHVQGPRLPEDNGHNHPFRLRRRIGDRYTWTIPFNTNKLECSTIPDRALERNYFSIHRSAYQPGGYGKKRHHGGTRDSQHYYSLKQWWFRSKVLQHVYTCYDSGMRDFMNARLQMSTVSELHKLDPAQRPKNYDEILSDCSDIDHALGAFDPPASWTYYDDEIPTWSKEYEERYPEPT